jgi:hypothetical protein
MIDILRTRHYWTDTSVRKPKESTQKSRSRKTFYTAAEHLFLDNYGQKKIPSDNHLEHDKPSQFNDTMTFVIIKWVK